MSLVIKVWDSGECLYVNVCLKCLLWGIITDMYNFRK